ncbi:MAG: PucR family transcriptional regulator [Hamadaea sp.]|nr:PucR family transcriptional regulator [Hamadaea sp.]
MHLRDILLKPELGLALLTADERAFDRTVTRVYTTDLIDPSRYLSGGEVVLSGLVWHRGPASSERFVAALARSGVAALGAGEAAFGRIPGDLVAACRRHEVPLFRVPVEVSFSAIQEAVAPAMWSERAAGLSTALSRHRTMVSALAAGHHLTELLPGLAAQLRLDCWVLTAVGRQRAGTTALDDDRAHVVLDAFHTAARLPVAVEVAGQPPILVHRAGGSVGQRLDAWCVATQGGTPGAADELVSLVELERASVDERHRVERRLTADLLEAIGHEGDTATVRAHMIACGLPPNVPVLVVAARLPGVAAPVALAVLDQLVAGGHRARGAAHRDEIAVAVLPVADDPDACLARLRAGVAALTPCLHGSRIAVGVSSVAADPGAMADALRQAVNMVQVAMVQGGSDQAGAATLVANDEVTSHRLLLAGVPAQTRQMFCDRLLGPLLAYDRDRHTDLVPTLRAFLETSGSWQECADRLHIHVNTLRHRLKRVEQLTGRDVNRLDDLVDLYLALRLTAS